jgi:hypothetical protein
MAEIKKATFNSSCRVGGGYSFRLQITDTQLSPALQILNRRINIYLEYDDLTSRYLHNIHFLQNQAFFKDFFKNEKYPR